MEDRENEIIADFKKGYPNLFRFRSNPNFALQEFRESYIFFQELNNLNDPFEGLSKRVDLNITIDSFLKSSAFKQFIDKDNEELTKRFLHKMSNLEFEHFINDLFESYIQQFGIACFTVHPSDFLMWCHYADGYRGLCFQYNTEKDNDFFKGWKPVEYVKSMKVGEIEVDYSEAAIQKLFFEKLKDWKNEREIRLIKTKKGESKIKPTCLKSIIFGFKTPNEVQNQFLEHASRVNSHVEFYKLEPKFTKNGILLTPLN